MDLNEIFDREKRRELEEREWHTTAMSLITDDGYGRMVFEGIVPNPTIEESPY